MCKHNSEDFYDVWSDEGPILKYGEVEAKMIVDI